MSIKSFLENGIAIKNSIKSKNAQIEELRMLSTQISSLKCTDGRKFTRVVDKIVDLEQEIISETDKLTNHIASIRKIIADASDTTSRTVLERKYILGETFERIAEEMGYCARQIQRIHNKSINQLNDLYPEIGEDDAETKNEGENVDNG